MRFLLTICFSLSLSTFACSQQDRADDPDFPTHDDDGEPADIDEILDDVLTASDCEWMAGEVLYLIGDLSAEYVYLIGEASAYGTSDDLLDLGWTISVAGNHYDDAVEAITEDRLPDCEQSLGFATFWISAGWDCAYQAEMWIEEQRQQATSEDEQ